ncbi:hypothetical protein [Virgibacillus pantothenticus]|uniref:hypothetical protein n=1 Tax=Virgibacillus pantothenticus TaxID=1473 RepID=UPI0009848F43|nr:hypothetical protein [Virgibacillus pantothenticus]
MKKPKVLLLLLSLSLVFSTIFPYVASAEESQKVAKPISNQNERSRVIVDQSPIVFESEGTIYEMNTEETNSEVVITFKSDKGIQTFVRNKDTDYIKVTSDYLPKDEITDLELSVNDIGDQIKEQLSNNESVTRISPSSSPNNIGIHAQVGKWAWSGWQNYTITPKVKYTVTAIAGAIVAYIPYVGPIATALATIFVQNKLKTGYFKRRIATRLDSDPRFYWQKTQVNLYKDKARKKLLSSKTTKPAKLYNHW